MSCQQQALLLFRPRASCLMQVRAVRDKGHKPNFALAFDSVLIHTGAAVVRYAIN